MSVCLWGSQVMVGRSQVGTMPSNSVTYVLKPGGDSFVDQGGIRCCKGPLNRGKILKQPGIYRLKIFIPLFHEYLLKLLTFSIGCLLPIMITRWELVVTTWSILNQFFGSIRRYCRQVVLTYRSPGPRSYQNKKIWGIGLEIPIFYFSKEWCFLKI